MSKAGRRSIGEYPGNSEGTHAERHWRRLLRIGGQPRWAGSTYPRLSTRLLNSPATFHFSKKERVPRVNIHKQASQIYATARRKRGAVSHTDAQAALVSCPL
jgi:hypothetical protein